MRAGAPAVCWDGMAAMSTPLRVSAPAGVLLHLTSAHVHRGACVYVSAAHTAHTAHTAQTVVGPVPVVRQVAARTGKKF
jgi:hypothetical protein